MYPSNRKRLYSFIEAEIRFNRPIDTSFLLKWNVRLYLSRNTVDRFALGRCKNYGLIISFVLFITLFLQFLLVSFHTLLLPAITWIIPKMRRIAKRMKVVLILCFLKDKLIGKQDL